VVVEVHTHPDHTSRGSGLAGGLACRQHGGRVPRGFLDFSAPSNPLGVPEFLREAIGEAVELGLYEDYPDYDYRDLREAVASFYGVEPEGVVPLNGAAEALSILLLCLKPRELVVAEPTFGEHRCLAGVAGINYVPVPYREAGDYFEFPLEGLVDAARAGDAPVVLLSNPNNPTGACAELSKLGELLSALQNSLVVVDEAFVELSTTCRSALELADDYENLAILRSFTKSFGVRGLRVGFLYTSGRRLAQTLDACRQPWNVNSVASYAIAKVLRDRGRDAREYLRRSAEVVEVERAALTEGLTELGVVVYRSHAPFVLARHTRVSARESLRRLWSRGIAVRDASSFPYLTEYHVRISVRLREDNARLLRAYRELGLG
jgi:histidinol-phosphate aminotransferase